MADDTLDVFFRIENHPERYPHGMLGYKLSVLSPEQQHELNALKISTVQEDHIYLATHPEVKAIIRLLLRAFCNIQPRNVHEFAAKFFRQPNIRNMVSDLIKPEEIRKKEEMFKEKRDEENKIWKKKEEKKEKTLVIKPSPQMSFSPTFSFATLFSRQKLKQAEKIEEGVEEKEEEEKEEEKNKEEEEEEEEENEDESEQVPGSGQQSSANSEDREEVIRMVERESSSMDDIDLEEAYGIESEEEEDGSPKSRVW